MFALAAGVRVPVSGCYCARVSPVRGLYVVPGHEIVPYGIDGRRGTGS